MSQPLSGAKPALSSKYRVLLGVLVMISVVGLGYRWYRAHQDALLLRTATSRLQHDDDLLAYADRRALPLYQEHCAGCHGADLKGDRSKGIPDLGDAVWLYGSGEITEIEQTLLYGIRSGHPKAHNLTDMPALGRKGQLSPNEVSDVVEYLLQLSRQPHDAVAAQRGALIFMDRGVCFDCHGSDAYGVPDYGVPGLTGRGGSWLYGGDRATLYKSTFDGRHGLCPAWIHTLSFAEIRALAAFLYHRTHSDTQPVPSSSKAGA